MWISWYWNSQKEINIPHLQLLFLYQKQRQGLPAREWRQDWGEQNNGLYQTASSCQIKETVTTIITISIIEFYLWRRKKTTVIIRQVIDMVHPTYETTSSVYCSSVLIFCKYESMMSFNTIKLTITEFTPSAPVTSTKTAKLVRCVLAQITDVWILEVLIHLVDTLSSIQLPFPKLLINIT